MNIACLGGGPAGLFSAIALKQALPAADVTVWDQNPAGATYGFGVVLSDEAMEAVRVADEDVYQEVVRQGAPWSEIDVYLRGEVTTSGGNGFTSMNRSRLVAILQQRARGLGINLLHDVRAPLPAETGADLVVVADGAASAARDAMGGAFGTETSYGACRFMWLATDRVYSAFSFFIKETEWGVMQVHAYPYDETGSTFLVEMHEDVWSRAGFADPPAGSLAPGQSDEVSVARCAEIFEDELQGGRLLAKNSKWLRFPTVVNARWFVGNVVLVGDAAHTAHWSIGSATKLAVEDAIALGDAFSRHGEDVASALESYQAERIPLVQSAQRAAAASREWFEDISCYMGQERPQLVFNLMTRSRRLTYDNLRLRDPEYVGAVDAWFEASVEGGGHGRRVGRRPPMFMPFRLRDCTIANRVVVSPMDQYSAVDGAAGDFHLVHLGSRALGGAGLIMTEMICVSPEGRITPGCGGLWDESQVPGWKRIVDFAHARSKAMLGAPDRSLRTQGVDAASLGRRGSAARGGGRALADRRPFAAALPARDQPGPA